MTPICKDLINEWWLSIFQEWEYLNNLCHSGIDLFQGNKVTVIVCKQKVDKIVRCLGVLTKICPNMLIDGSDISPFKISTLDRKKVLNICNALCDVMYIYQGLESLLNTSIAKEDQNSGYKVAYEAWGRLTKKYIECLEFHSLN